MENSVSAEQIGPTIASVLSESQDGGAKAAIAVVFKDSGYRYAARAATLPLAIERVKSFAAEFPYGLNRHGGAWIPRDG